MAYRGRIIAFLRKYETASNAIRTVDLNECDMSRFLEYSVQHIDYSCGMSSLTKLFSIVKITIDNILRCK